MLRSQAPRSSSRRQHMYRRHNRGSRRILAAVVVVAVGLVIVWQLTPRDDAPEAPAEPGAAASDPVTEKSEPSGLLPAMNTSLSASREEAPEAEPVAAEVAGGEEAEPETTGEVAAVEPEPAAPREAAPEAPEPAAEAGPLERPAAGPAMQLVEKGRHLAAANKPVEARATLTAALNLGELDEAGTAEVRALLGEINQRLVFSPQVVPSDPFSFAYVVQSGDSLAGIASRLAVQVDWRFLKRINGIRDEKLIRPGQRIKVVTGPFHALIDKSNYRMDIYLGEGANQVFVDSIQVGLGQYDSTPTGLFRVRPESKLIDPAWVNPRTRQRYAPDDPANPIGERWIGLEGLDEATTELAGYGIHGTIEPESIGAQASMGCIRLRHEDVVLVYEMLVEEVSLVKITG